MPRAETLRGRPGDWTCPSVTGGPQGELGLSVPEHPDDGSSGAAGPETPRETPETRETRRVERKVWSVTEVNRAVRVLLEDTIPPVWVSGEVASWTRARSGHCYFTLKDESSQLRCVLWRTDAERLPADPAEGMSIRALGGLTLYEARGDYQMVVRRVEATEGEGLWRLAFERLRAKLDEEGLTAPERKRALPRLPSRVGIVTSQSGAALHDILTRLEARCPWVRVVFRGARVQGEGAALEIARALGAIGASGLVDVVIVGRGGGSLEDLWAFNEEPVARAIASCPVPVVSAVGHEVDVTIADLVADLRAPTPSAAAELVTEGAHAALAQVARIRPRLARALGRGVERMDAKVRRGRLRIDNALRTVYLERRSQMERSAAKIHALSPLRTLARGYSVAQTPDGVVLRSVTEFDVGHEFGLRLSDGQVTARTVSAEPAREHGLGRRGAGDS